MKYQLSLSSLLDRYQCQTYDFSAAVRVIIHSFHFFDEEGGRDICIIR